MSTDTETHAPGAHDAADAHEGGHDHPSDLKYIKIAAILAALTLIEVLTYTFDITGGTLVAILFPLMFIKFAIVAGYFMHLKFDSKLFTTMFVSGLAFAVVIYCVMLTVFEFW
jgi:cytochrome c oxidase subunit 4